MTSDSRDPNPSPQERDRLHAKPIEKGARFASGNALMGDSKHVKSGEALPRSSNPVFDAGAVLDSLEGDSELLREIAGIFRTQSSKHMERIRAGVSKQDPKMLERAAHALKGSAANLLAREVMEAASKLEEIGRAGSVAGAKEGLVTLEEVLAKLQLALAEFEKE